MSLLPKHPHPKIWGQSHLHAGYSPFNGKDLLIWLLESSALLHPWCPAARGVPGENAPRGESCRLCQVSRHKEHTWSGITRNTPGVASPAQGCAWDRSNLSIQPRISSRTATSGGYRAQITAGLTLQFLLPEATKGFGSCSLRSCCRALGRAEQQLLCRARAATGAISWETNIPLLDRKRS